MAERPDTDALAFAQRFADDLAVLLGADLVGVYLHGSLAMGCFNPARSDVDILGVTRRALEPATRHKVAELLLARSKHPYPIEISVLTVEQLRPWRHPTPFDFHFSERWRETLARGELPAEERRDPDLAAHVATLRARGRALLGAPVHEVFPEVPEADFRESILGELDWVRRESTQIYGVLNACRVLAYVSGAGILSKAEAGDWALSAIPAELRPTLVEALAAYRDGADEPCAADEVRRFVSWVAEGVRALSPLGRHPQAEADQHDARGSIE